MAEYWIGLFFACHHIQVGAMGGASVNQWRTPDGGSYLEQPAILTQIFELLISEVRSEIASKADSHGR